MTRDQFIYGLTACGCLLKDGKTWYEHNELIKCFEDLGLFEQEPRKITLEDVKEYCEPRCLTIVSNELYYEMTHPKIKALEQEPCEDAISRQEVLDLIADYDLSMGQVVRGIHALPSVTSQEPRKGHWISHGEHCENLGVIPSGLGAYEWCSNCDCGIDVREWHRNNYNYCPNCGADMRGEVEDGNDD